MGVVVNILVVTTWLRCNRLADIRAVLVGIHASRDSLLFFQEQPFEQGNLAFAVMPCQALQSTLGVQAPVRSRAAGSQHLAEPLPLVVPP